MVNDSDDVLPPVDVVRKRRLAEIAGLAIIGGVIDRDEYLKHTHKHGVNKNGKTSSK